MSTTKDEVVKVVFRIDKYGKFANVEGVFAMFPELPGNYIQTTACLGYTHIGQHGSYDYQYCIDTTRQATPEEYARLKAELESLGYKLKVIKRYVKPKPKQLKLKGV